MTKSLIYDLQFNKYLGQDGFTVESVTDAGLFEEDEQTDFATTKIRIPQESQDLNAATDGRFLVYGPDGFLKYNETWSHDVSYSMIYDGRLHNDQDQKHLLDGTFTAVPVTNDQVTVLQNRFSTRLYHGPEHPIQKTFASEADAVMVQISNRLRPNNIYDIPRDLDGSESVLNDQFQSILDSIDVPKELNVNIRYDMDEWDSNVGILFSIMDSKGNKAFYAYDAEKYPHPRDAGSQCIHIKLALLERSKVLVETSKKTADRMDSDLMDSGFSDKAESVISGLIDNISNDPLPMHSDFIDEPELTYSIRCRLSEMETYGIDDIGIAVDYSSNEIQFTAAKDGSQLCFAAEYQIDNKNGYLTMDQGFRVILDGQEEPETHQESSKTIGPVDTEPENEGTAKPMDPEPETYREGSETVGTTNPGPVSETAKTIRKDSLASFYHQVGQNIREAHGKNHLELDADVVGKQFAAAIEDLSSLSKQGMEQ